MKRIVWLFAGFLLLSVTVSGQGNSFLLKKLVRVKSVLVDEKNKEYTIYGGGFIVSGKYLATCYSSYKPTGFTGIPKRMVVYYNYSVNEKIGLKSDSAEVDLGYKYTAEQYDFSKHSYKPDKLETDFIVLKLKQLVAVATPVLNKEENRPKYSRLPVIAFDNVSRQLRSDTLSYLFKQFYNGETAQYQLVMFGASKVGYSGSPIYNEKGEMVALLQFSLSEINEKYVSQLLKAGWLSDEDVQGIRHGYASFDPANLIFGTNANYLWDTYLRGF